MTFFSCKIREIPYFTDGETEVQIRRLVSDELINKHLIKHLLSVGIQKQKSESVSSLKPFTHISPVRHVLLSSSYRWENWGSVICFKISQMVNVSGFKAASISCDSKFSTLTIVSCCLPWSYGITNASISLNIRVFQEYKLDLSLVPHHSLKLWDYIVSVSWDPRSSTGGHLWGPLYQPPDFPNGIGIQVLGLESHSPFHWTTHRQSSQGPDPVNSLPNTLDPGRGKLILVSDLPISFYFSKGSILKWGFQMPGIDPGEVRDQTRKVH